VGEMGSILRFDGTTWMPMTSNTVRTLIAIWGAKATTSTSATTIVAAGAAGTVQRYDGSDWQAAPNTPLNGLTLRGVWTSGTRTVAVGINSSSMAVIATTEAAGWNTQTASPMYLQSVWGVADDNIYAVGAGGTIMQFDGARWMPMTSGTQQPLQAVSGTTTNVYVVGNVGTILRLGVN
ncbi:MAG TPA: hypothetical protein VFV99_13570, partial [Kofleriaceae bacterium]|nr:hypothetical protein [Kofleriaceae bacterium]